MLTDEEVQAIYKSREHLSTYDQLRAIEAAILKKLSEQKAAGYFYQNANLVCVECDPKHKDEGDVFPLYLHPAPPSEGYQLVPIEPNQAILDLMYSNGIDMHDGDLVNVWKAMLEAAKDMK